MPHERDHPGGVDTDQPADSGTEAAARIARPIRVYWKKTNSRISSSDGDADHLPAW